MRPFKIFLLEASEMVLSILLPKCKEASEMVLEGVEVVLLVVVFFVLLTSCKLPFSL